jgi:hypothetical protein
MIRLGWIILSASLLVLSACVPAKGSSSLNAFNLVTGEAKFVAGNKGYISHSWSPKTFAVELPDLRDFFATFEGQTIRTSLPGFTARQKGLPIGWNFQLYETTGIQKITNVDETGNQVNVTWDESIVTTFTLCIPDGTEEGTYSGSVVLNKENHIQVIPVRVTIVADHKKVNCNNS